MIKLLALDLDGTLLDSTGEVPEENLRAIRAAEEKGVIVTIATGRRFRDARPVVNECGFDAPFISHNGALLKHAETLETVHVELLSPETVDAVLAIGRAGGGDALVSVDPDGDGLLLYDRISDANVPLRKYIAWAERLHGEGADISVRHVERLEDELGGQQVVHISYSGTCAAMDELRRVLESDLAAPVNILPTIYPQLDFTLLDILPPRASKASGVGWLAERHGLSRENVMVCGDNYNDLEMLEFAGTPVVMGNAPDDLKFRDRFETTLSNDQNGVALAIEKFIL